MCSNVINFHDGKYGLKYERYYLSKYHDQNTIVVVFKFANNSGETFRYGSCSNLMEIAAFQHGISLDVSDSYSGEDPIVDNNYKKIQDGYSIEFGVRYTLEDLSDIDIEVYYDENKIRKQTVKISDQDIEDTNTSIDDFIPVKPAVVEHGEDNDNSTYHITSEDEFWDLVEKYDLQEEYEGQFEELIEQARVESYDYDTDILQTDMELEEAIQFHGGDPFDLDDNRQAFFGDFDFDNDNEDE